ncbi:hypothetical protein [Methanolapillus africanus]|uniref:hypothetical protein n=1 Tax=Methanolapillus africanus TaxID=3028297 RepID=UPI0030B91756
MCSLNKREQARRLMKKIAEDEPDKFVYTAEKGRVFLSRIYSPDDDQNDNDDEIDED